MDSGALDGPAPLGDTGVLTPVASMFSYQLYKVVHFLGILLTFVALGGQILHVRNGGDKASNSGRALVGATHGIGLFLVLLGGFGMLARMGLSFGDAPWVHAKLLIWLLLGGVVALPYRVPASAKALWFVVPLLGALAAGIAIYKPF